MSKKLFLLSLVFCFCFAGNKNYATDSIRHVDQTFSRLPPHTSPQMSQQLYQAAYDMDYAFDEGKLEYRLCRQTLLDAVRSNGLFSWSNILTLAIDKADEPRLLSLAQDSIKSLGYELKNTEDASIYEIVSAKDTAKSLAQIFLFENQGDRFVLKTSTTQSNATQPEWIEMAGWRDTERYRFGSDKIRLKVITNSKDYLKRQYGPQWKSIWTYHKTKYFLPEDERKPLPVMPLSPRLHDSHSITLNTEPPAFIEPQKTDPQIIRDLYQAAYDMHYVFNESKLDYRTCQHTLLSVVRNTGLSPWDTTISFAIDNANESKLNNEVPSFLKKLGYALSPSQDPHIYTISLKAKEGEGHEKMLAVPLATIFLYENRDNKFILQTSSHKDSMEKEDWEAIKLYQFERGDKVKLRGLANPEGYLQNLYGDKWRTHEFRGTLDWKLGEDGLKATVPSGTLIKLHPEDRECLFAKKICSLFNFDNT